MLTFKQRFFTINNNDEKIVFDIDTSNIYGIHSDNELTKESLIPGKDYIFPKEFSECEEYSTLVISCAETCNLRCTYCFANEGTYNSISNKIMKDADYSLLLDKLLKKEYPIKVISLFGGEPLLGLKYIKKFIQNLQSEYLKKTWDMPIIGIVTNGTLIDEETIDFFNKYHIIVTISIDGDKSINDINRMYANKSISVYDTIVDNLSRIQNRQFQLTSAATLSREIISQYKKGDYVKYLDHFEKLGFNCVEHFIADEDTVLTDYQITKIQQFAVDQVETTFKRLASNNLYVPYGVLGLINSIVKRKYKVECGAGINQIYYTANGEFYPCQLYYAARTKQRLKIHRTDINSCRDCFCINICSAYCPGGSVLLSSTENSVVPSRCIYQKALTEAVIRNLYLYFQKNKDTRIKKIIVKNIKELSKKGMNALRLKY